MLKSFFNRNFWVANATAAITSGLGIPIVTVVFTIAMMMVPGCDHPTPSRTIIIHKTATTQPTPAPAAPLAPGTSVGKDGTINAPPGAVVTYEDTWTEDMVGPAMTRKDTAKASGPSTDVMGSKLDGTMKSDASKVQIEGVDSEGVGGGGSEGVGGANASGVSAVGEISKPTSMYIFGGLLLLAGALCAYFFDKTLGGLIAAVGILCISLATLVEKFPLLMALPALAFMCVLGYGLIKATKVKRTGAAAAVKADDHEWVGDIFIQAIDNFSQAHPEQASDLMDFVRNEAAGEYALDFKNMVTATKDRLGIKPEDALVAIKKKAAARTTVPAGLAAASVGPFVPVVPAPLAPAATPPVASA